VDKCLLRARRRWNTNVCVPRRYLGLSRNEISGCHSDVAENQFSSGTWCRFLFFIVSQDLSAFATILPNVADFYQSTRRNVSEDSNIQDAANLFIFACLCGNLLTCFQVLAQPHVIIYRRIKVEGEAMSKTWLTIVCEINPCLCTRDCPVCLYSSGERLFAVLWLVRPWLPPTKRQNISVFSALKESSFSVSRISFILLVEYAYLACACYSANLQATRWYCARMLIGLAFSSICSLFSV